MKITLNKIVLFGKIHPSLSLVIIAIIVAMISLSIPETTRELSLLKAFMMALIPLGFIYGANKGKLRRPLYDKNKSILYWSIYMIVIAAVVGVSALWVIANIQTLQIIVPESFDNIMFLLASTDIIFWVEFILFCLLIGIFEEVFFRGILLEFLIAGFSRTSASETAFLDKKETDKQTLRSYEVGFRGLLKAVVFSSLIFSIFHIQGVVGGVLPNEAANISIIAFKVLQALFFSFFMSALYLKTKSLFPCVVIHALVDIFLLAPNALSTSLFVGNSLTGTIFDIALLGACAILFLPLAFISYRVIKSIEIPYRSLFMTAQKRSVCERSESPQ